MNIFLIQKYSSFIEENLGNLESINKKSKTTHNQLQITNSLVTIFNVSAYCT